MAAKITLPRIGFQNLRHTYASQMPSTQDGKEPAVAFGDHLDLDSYVMPGMQADAAEQVDAALQAAISASRKPK